MRKDDKWIFMSVRKAPNGRYYGMAWKLNKRRNQHSSNHVLRPIYCTDTYKGRSAACGEIGCGVYGA